MHFVAESVNDVTKCIKIKNIFCQCFIHFIIWLVAHTLLNLNFLLLYITPKLINLNLLRLTKNAQNIYNFKSLYFNEL